METGQNEGGVLNFLDSVGQNHRTIWLRHSFIFHKKKGDSEIVGAGTPVMGPLGRLVPPQFQRVGLPLWFLGGTLQRHWGDSALQVDPEDSALNQKDYYGALRSDGICLVTFWACWRPVTPSFFPISPFWNGSVCPTTVFWKHSTCLVSQVHSWRGILPQGELYLKSHPYLTQIIFKGDFGLGGGGCFLSRISTCLIYLYFLFYLFLHAAWGILIPWSRIKRMSPALKCEVLTMEHQGSPLKGDFGPRF